MTQTIGMIGVGHMGSAIARGIRASREDVLIKLNTIFPEQIEELAKEINAEIVLGKTAYSHLIHSSDLIFIGVTPKDVAPFFESIRDDLSEDEPKTWVSMCAGVTMDQLKSYTPNTHRWIRIMPNTPIAIGEGYVAYCPSENTREKDIALLKSILESVCILEKLPESAFSAVTGLPGSGPAFVYILIDALSDAGVLHGLSREQAVQMAAKMVKGAASMVLETGEQPGVLKDQITSPAGTTIEGVIELEKAGFRQAIIRGLDASIKKADEMSRK